MFSFVNLQEYFDMRSQAASYNSSACKDFLITKTVALDNGDKEKKREEIRDYFHKTFSLYESLFECLENDKAFYARANPLRHPLIFYYGHTAVFFVNKLNVSGFINTRIDKELESTLAVGVDEMSWDDLNKSNYDWPTPSRVKDYRDKVRNLVDNFITQCDFTMPIEWDSPLWIVMMGIEHERIHLETSSVLIRELPLEVLRPHPIWSNICTESGSAPDNALVDVTGGVVHLGKDKDNTLYGWDNEYGSHSENVKSFKASKYLLSNKEFLEFVEDQGYQKKQYWDDEGWGWVTYRKAEYPVFWIKDKANNNFKYRTMLQEIDMPWNWPVDINYLEAKAFCTWKSEKTDKHIRMPTEAEWYKLRELVDVDQPEWESAPGNINLEHGMSSCPVNRHAFAKGFYDLIGNVWQWTETPIDGFDGFKVHESYDDFSTPTFDGKHNVFKGGCWASTGNYAVKDSRYAFRRHFYQHSGLRYVEAEPLDALYMNTYEADETLSKYIEFHYGYDKLNIENFPVSCVKKIENYIKGHIKKQALDIGCASGRSSFELAKHYEHVDALDLSVRLIEAPTNLQKTGVQRYAIADEGELVHYKDVKLSDYEGYEDVKDKITFMQGDACNLDEKFTGYDLVFAGNLIDRLYDPAAFLHLIQDRINPDGFLILVSPYDWQVEHTPRNKWLGGFKANTGESYTTLEGVENILSSQFEMLDIPMDIPFVIQKTTRNFSFSISEMSVWKKKV